MLLAKPTCQELVWEELVPATSFRIPTRRDAAIGYYAREDAVYIFGGKSTGNKALKDIYKFDLNRKIWERVFTVDDERLNGRFGMVYGTNGDSFYIATGQGMRIK